ncbi:MAG: polysaccharide biosynthesis/export family protein [Gemmataceae bacterium]
MSAVLERPSLSVLLRAGGLTAVAVVLALCAGGCAAITNPVAEGVPVRKVPDELLVTARKNAACTIPLNLLSPPRPDVYRLAPGDVLAVFVDGFLGAVGQAIPVNLGGLSLTRDQRRDPASTGYPVPVRADGTVYLPVAGSLSVQGMTLVEAQQAVRRHYISRNLLRDENANVLINLLQPRQYSVVVLRQEAASFSYGQNGQFAAGRRGTGWEIDLPAYENDVLHALRAPAAFRASMRATRWSFTSGCFVTPSDRAALLAALGKVPANANPVQFLGLPGAVIRIPLHAARTHAGDPAGRRHPGERRRGVHRGCRTQHLLRRRIAAARRVPAAARPRHGCAGGGGVCPRAADQRLVRRQQPVRRPGSAGHRLPVGDPPDGRPPDACRRPGADRGRPGHCPDRQSRADPGQARRRAHPAREARRGIRPLLHADPGELHGGVGRDSPSTPPVSSTSRRPTGCRGSRMSTS